MAVEASEKKKLYDAVENEDVATIHEVLLQNPNIVKEVSFACSRNLLHIATMHGKEAIVEKVLETHPRLARDLDATNSSPLHIAAAKGSVEIAKKLIEIAPETRWWRDSHGMNPVHIAAVNGHVEMLWKLLEFDSFPAMERVHRGQTVLHLCVKHGQAEALEFLVDKLGKLVYAKDDDGETILHLAVKFNKLENIRHSIIQKQTSTDDGETPRPILKLNPNTINYSEIEGSLKVWSKQPILSILPKLTASTMVVVVLIATMAFAAGVSPPGGVWQEDTPSHRAGEAVMASTHPRIYKQFVRANTTAFISSLIAIFLVTTGQPSARVHFMFISLFAMWVSLAAIAVSYGASVKVVTPNTEMQSLDCVITAVVFVPLGILGFIYVYSSVRQGYLSRKSKLRRQQRLTTDSPVSRAFEKFLEMYDAMEEFDAMSRFTPLTIEGRLI